jgi:hypothetical protein
MVYRAAPAQVVLGLLLFAVPGQMAGLFTLVFTRLLTRQLWPRVTVIPDQ